MYKKTVFGVSLCNVVQRATVLFIHMLIPTNIIASGWLGKMEEKFKRFSSKSNMYIGYNIWWCVVCMYVTYTHARTHVRTHTHLMTDHVIILHLVQLLLTQDMVFISAQIARGMYHLSRKGGIIHKDLAARNI